MANSDGWVVSQAIAATLCRVRHLVLQAITPEETSMTSQWIDIPAQDGKTFKGYLALPPAGHGPGIVLIQESSE